MADNNDNLELSQDKMTEQEMEEFMKAAGKLKQHYDGTTKDISEAESEDKAIEDAMEEDMEEKICDLGEGYTAASSQDDGDNNADKEELEGSLKDKKGLFGKKKDKKDKKDVLIEELTDRLKRQMAEFDNFRKRTEKEKSNMYEIGARSVIEKILPIVDNFERGLDAAAKEDKSNSFAEGMDMIYKQLLTTLEELGVKEIEAVGNEFDPSLHNAVLHIEDEELGENVVAEEFQKGYTYHDNVIRHSMVKVAN